jgi:hypothetical protein
VIYQK